jgi:hypothetical protein
MTNFIRRAFDAVRLTRELATAEIRIAVLEGELKHRHSGPSFSEVATDFDASALFPQLVDKVIDDLAPFIEQDALTMLKAGFTGVQRDRGSRATMHGLVAKDYASRTFQFRFEIGRMGTTVNVVDLN